MTSYKTTDTDYTALTLTNSGSVSINTDNPFDGSPSYAGFFVSATTDVVVIDIACPVTFSWGTNFYIDFGSTSWRAKDVYIYAFNTSSDNSQKYYKLMGPITGQARGEFVCYNSYTFVRASDGGTSQGFNRLRIVLTNFNNTTPRIAAIGILNYGSSGLKETFISRGGSSVYGNIYPHTDSVYTLGDSSHNWSSVYTDTLNVSSTTKVTNLNADKVDDCSVNDAGTTASDLWTANKINAQLATKAPTSHTHTKSQITDMPTNLSQFVNDIGAGAGLNIVPSSTEPTLNSGDWWYQEL